MRLRSIASVKSLKGKTVLLRLDLNVSIDSRGRIADGGDARIHASVPVVKMLAKAGARTIIVAHLGRPHGRDAKLSLAPVCRRLAAVLGKDVHWVPEPLDHDGAVETRLRALKNGGVAMLENIRFYNGEESDSPFLARRLASLADIYVNDAFGVSHRAQASVSGVAKLLPSYAGPLLQREVDAISMVLEKPKKPMVVLMGGAKVSDKIHVLEHMTSIATHVLVGGAMANAFFKAQGISTGKSEVAPVDVRLAKGLLRKKNILLPVDVIASESLDGKRPARMCGIRAVAKNEYIADAGVETVRQWSAIIRKAKTLVWNGPLGMFEVKKFSHASIALGSLVAARSKGAAYGVVGGGETVSCLGLTGMAEYVDHVSTGGGAMLDFLAGKDLPGVLPLMAGKRSTKRK